MVSEIIIYPYKIKKLMVKIDKYYCIIFSGLIILPLGDASLYIQKKGNAYYYRELVWKADRIKPDNICIYLGSNTMYAINKLKTIVTDEDDFNILRAKVYALSTPTMAEVIDNTLNTLENAIRQAEVLGADELQSILYEAECKLRAYRSETKDKKIPLANKDNI